jgi:bifunctional non-homologous end joining protein LigD
VSPDRVQTEVDGRQLSLSNLEKVLYPEAGFTKAAMLDYYARIAAVMLPHLERRPLTIRRYPDGVAGPSFFAKNVPPGAPPWLQTVTVPSTSRRTASGTSSAAGAVTHIVCADRPTLIWAANLAALEFHVPLWRIGGRGRMPGRPDHLVFDLDPGPGTSIVECARIATWLAERLASFDVDPPLAKTSGSKGMQLYARLRRAVDWPTARDQAHDLAVEIAADHPELVVTNMRKDLRSGRVLIDWSQNHPAKTTVAAYSLRARPTPTVSTPITWDEVSECAQRGDPGSLQFEAGQVLDRVERDGDLFAALVTGSSTQADAAE